VAPVVDGESVTVLLYLSHTRDPNRFAVGPTLAAAAERAGYGFECYYDDFRAGRHFGGGDSENARPGWASGSLVAGGRHADHALWLAAEHEVLAVGDPGSLLWPALEAAGVEEIVRSADSAELYRAAFRRLRQGLPDIAIVLDSTPQGPSGLLLAPYCYPCLLAGEPALGVDRSNAEQLRAALGIRNVTEIDYPVAAGEGYARVTAALAERYADWGEGILLGDPDLVAAQLPRARRLRLLPLYGRPQIDVLDRAAELVEKGREPVYGRQYDDRDFLALSRLGHGLQVVDPDPPFDSERSAAPAVPEPPRSLWEGEPDDAELARWADEGRVLVTLLFWTGMIRELHCVPRLIDLAAATGLRAGLVLTAETLAHTRSSSLALLAAPPERGGVLGLLEPLLGSTGLGVAAETLLPDGKLAESLREARAVAEWALPAQLVPRGHWPLLDAPLVPHRARRVGRRGRVPVVRFTARERGAEGAPEGPGERRRRRDLRSLAGTSVRRLGLARHLEERRPFEERRPGAIDERVADAVREAGFTYMWSKSGFGTAKPVLVRDDFVALPFTAGNWDGWSPFYTVGEPDDLLRAERRLRRRRAPGWLASTIDSPLFLLPGESLEHSSRLYRIAELAAQGGRSGRLVNVTPHVIARYARLLAVR
jgi:hypothetical protein